MTGGRREDATADRPARPDGFGDRARLGLVYIASSIVMEPECYAMAPAGVSIHTTRIPLGGTVDAGTLAALGGADARGGGPLLDATRLLAAAPLHSIVFACTSGSFIGGKGYDGRILAQMAAVARGIPVTTTTTALVAGLRTLDVRRIALATPYTETVTGRAVAYLEGHDFQIVSRDCLGLDQDWAIGSTPLATVRALVRSVDRPEADAVVIACTNLRTAGILDELETALGKPVVSANQASFWHGLRLAGYPDPVLDYGRLLRL
jgi:maleate isomerase